MPRISTDNYDTVASWNGSQDLFIVEQPDGTKVATPAMVKQFIEAGDFVATGEVVDGHGNVLADVDAEIGDLSQTTVTGDTVAAQLKSIKNVITFDKVPDSFITLQSGISIVTNQVYKQGNHVFGWITFSFSAQTPSALKLGVLNSGYRPSGISRMMVGLGTQPWTSEYVGYCLRDSDYSLGVTGYNNNIRAAHIHLDYVI